MNEGRLLPLGSFLGGEVCSIEENKERGDGEMGEMDWRGSLNWV